jgi:hypothetical protein
MLLRSLKQFYIFNLQVIQFLKQNVYIELLQRESDMTYTHSQINYLDMKRPLLYPSTSSAVE